MAKKRKAAARRRTRRRPAARRRRASSADTTINTLVVLVLIVMVLGGLYLYTQNKKQAGLSPVSGHAIATLIAPQPASQTPALQPAAVVLVPAPQLAVAQMAEPAAGPETPQPIAAVEAK